MKTFLLTASLLFIAVPATGHASAALTGHALIAPYEGSTIRRKDVKEFDEYSAFTGMDETGKQPTSLSLEGKVTKILYKQPKERSILELFRNYEMAVKQAGGRILFSCNQEKYECVKAYAGPTLQKLSDLHAISNTAGRYLLAQIEQDEQVAYIAIAVGQSHTDIHVIEVKKMQTGMVTLDAAALGEGIDARGYVVVEGIFFDTDKATLQPQSGNALGQMAKLLNDRPDLKVYIVGHTDSQGSFAHNQSLSERRAQAVVEELARNHGIDRARMAGHGVGPLAPQSSNTSETGRAANRRVVLVAQ